MENGTTQQPADGSRVNPTAPPAPASSTNNPASSPAQAASEASPSVDNQIGSPQIVAPMVGGNPSPEKKRKNKLSFWITLVVLAIIFLAVPVPAILVSGFMTGSGSSGSLTTGTNGLSCTGSFQELPTTIAYSGRRGLPLTYSYSASSKIRTTCNGQERDSSGGQSSSFGVIPLVLDIVIAFLLAFVISKLFGKKTA